MGHNIPKRRRTHTIQVDVLMSNVLHINWQIYYDVCADIESRFGLKLSNREYIRLHTSYTIRRLYTSDDPRMKFEVEFESEEELIEFKLRYL